MEKIEKLLATGNTHATVNRDPNAQRSEFGAFDLKLSAPGVESLEFIATESHPTAEQLFAGAWSACYTTVFGIVASMKMITLPSDYSVDIQVNLGQTGTAWFLGARFTVRVPGLATEAGSPVQAVRSTWCPCAPRRQMDHPCHVTPCRGARPSSSLLGIEEWH